jgi:hypothetical protein
MIPKTTSVTDRQTSSTNAAPFMKCSCCVSLHMLRMDVLRSQYDKEISYSLHSTDGHLMLCKTSSMTDKSAICSVSCIFLFLLLAFYSRTDIPSSQHSNTTLPPSSVLRAGMFASPSG